jgi:hypothetical protein
MEMEREELIKILLAAYCLGCYCANAVNTGRKGFTPSMAKRERSALNTLLRKFGEPKLTDEEYNNFV